MKKIINVPEILLPNKDIDYSKWAVVACDQFTSEPDYWKKLRKCVGDEYSTLNIVFPEVNLGKGNDNNIIKNINNSMQNYIDKQIFYKINDSFILVDRTLNDGRHRLGLMIAIDLDEYDFSPESNASIKATEGTVVDRIPPRLKIRKDALLELPHIMLLMDNRKCNIIENLYKDRKNLEKLYDFDLNMNGGKLKGYKVENTKEVIEQIYELLDEKTMIEKYGKVSNILFAVGDGNHSLATAKAHWNSIKEGLTKEQRENHPARYALCELVNLHDEGLKFEPIHRIVLNVDEEFVNELIQSVNGENELKMVFNGKNYTLKVSKSEPKAIKDVQSFIDKKIKEDNKIVVDYVHGDNNLLEVQKRTNGLAVFMPTIKKEDLFKYIIKYGVLPRKAFSMGEANDKRYYFEAKKIVLMEE